ncbi:MULTISPECIES: hypothetical protein [unclassified Herbaspirillum]|uniref:hypothetical protein n=1 Tax=unclassified Herbaspirillum TaxID=2624150 RepID=UPI000C0A90BE|nr:MULTISPECIES: hypothetical protein [unclassified Herbaspirillum]MAF05932.1 hypothetical protein [Herbaspirillum sp.]MBO17892.1 hypothetical protein [Herbaspirillum sp.]|tara:strand:- start:335 stop:547 length:213 start_codon:yes stop_codon:yes gene_type:complete
MQNDLITIEEIAEMHHCSVRHARDVLVKMPGFPAPGPTSGRKLKVWIRSEVRAFVTRKATQIPHTARQAA